MVLEKTGPGRDNNQRKNKLNRTTESEVYGYEEQLGEKTDWRTDVPGMPGHGAGGGAGADES